MTPRELLQQIIDENPNTDHSVLFEKFQREVQNYPAVQRQILEEVASEPEGLDLIKKFLAQSKPN